MAQDTTYELLKDKQGMTWDLILYIPTILVLILVAAQMWYSGNQGFTYMLMFLTTFIVLIAFNRIFKTRLMLMPSSPTRISVSKKSVKLKLKNESEVELAKDVRFFSDLAGKSFGLAGVDLTGKRQQYVFHKGQFGDEIKFNDIKSALRIFK